jgi:hypothetical protein
MTLNTSTETALNKGGSFFLPVQFSLCIWMDRFWGELDSDINNKKANENLRKALSLAKTQTDKQAIQRKIDKL